MYGPASLLESLTAASSTLDLFQHAKLALICDPAQTEFGVMNLESVDDVLQFSGQDNVYAVAALPHDDITHIMAMDNYYGLTLHLIEHLANRKPGSGLLDLMTITAETLPARPTAD